MRQFRALFLVALGLLLGAMAVWSEIAPRQQGDSPTVAFVAAHVPSSQADSGRKLTLNAIQSTPAKTAGRSDVDLDVDVTNEARKTSIFPTRGSWSMPKATFLVRRH